MNIAVCIKQVPGTSNVQVDEATGVLKRDGVASKLNPYDLFAIELALQLKALHGGSVQVVTMGPPQAKQALLEALWMGADSALLLSDRRFAGADVVATSYAISQGLRTLGDVDLILCGKQTTDGDTAQVPAETAEFLGMTHAAGVQAVLDADAASITVQLNLDSRIQVQRMPLPCLLAVDQDINTPRLPSFKRKQAVAADAVRTLSLDDMQDQDEKHYGLKGSPTQVERIFPPPKGEDRRMLRGNAQALAQQLFELLGNKKLIGGEGDGHAAEN